MSAEFTLEPHSEPLETSPVGAAGTFPLSWSKWGGRLGSPGIVGGKAFCL